MVSTSLLKKRKGSREGRNPTVRVNFTLNKTHGMM